MRHGLGEVDKKRFAFIRFFYVINAFFSIQGSEVTLVFDIEKDAFVMHERERKHVIGVRDAKELFKTMIRRESAVQVPKMPFTDSKRGITFFLQHLR